MEIKYYRKLKNIDRMQGLPKQRNYSLMEHSYMVTVLFRHFASIENVSYDMCALDIVMHHDIVESVTMDLPWPIKNHNSETKLAWGVIEEELIKTHFQLSNYSDTNIKGSLTPLQYSLFKACDTLDLLIFVKEEQALGNNTKELREVESNCLGIFKSIGHHFPKISKYIETLYE